MPDQRDETTTERPDGRPAAKRGGASAGEFLRRRYVGDDAARAARVEAERVNAQVAQTIYDQRKAAGLTQRQLADLVGTTQSVISRLEDADYDGHSLTMLERIAQAVNRRVRIVMEPQRIAHDVPAPSDPPSDTTDVVPSTPVADSAPGRVVGSIDAPAARAWQSGPMSPTSTGTAPDDGGPDPSDPTLEFVFRALVQGLRRQRGLTVNQFAQKLGADRDEVLGMERTPGYRPSPRVLYNLSQFSGIPQRRLALMVGAIARVPADVREEASRFAAKSESFAKLSRDEQRVLDEFVKFLKSEV